jgi:hypothetical protein
MAGILFQPRTPVNSSIGLVAFESGIAMPAWCGNNAISVEDALEKATNSSPLVATNVR